LLVGNAEGKKGINLIYIGYSRLEIYKRNLISVSSSYRLRYC
jgi:hypothetical protein